MLLTNTMAPSPAVAPWARRPAASPAASGRGRADRSTRATFFARLRRLALLALALSLPACAAPPEPVSPSAIVETQVAEASRLEAEARQLPPVANEEATARAYKALSLRREGLGDAHPDTWRAARLLSTLYLQAGDLERAESAIQYELAAQERALGPASGALAGPLGLLTEVAIRRRDLPRAEQLSRRTVVALESGLGPWHPDVAVERRRLASILVDLCRGEEARVEIDRTLEIQGRAQGGASPELAGSWRALARAQWLTGDEAGAEASEQRAVALLSADEWGQTEPLLAALEGLATLLDARHQPEQARAARERAVAVGLRTQGVSQRATVAAVARLWLAYRTTRGAEEAERLLAQVGLVRLERARPGVTPPLPISPAPALPKCPTETTPAVAAALEGGVVAGAARVVSGMESGLRRCYDEALAVDRDVVGAAQVVARVEASGEVSAASAFVQAGTMKSVGECVLDTVLRARFSPPERAPTRIVIPVTFVTR